MDRRTVLTGSLAMGAIVASKPLCSQASEPRSLLDFIPREHHAAIRAGTSEFDCAPALQRAIDETARAKVPLLVPAGTYVLVPATPVDHEDGSLCLGAVIMRSGMAIHGEPRSILRIRGGISSDLVPRSMAMFCTDRPIAGIAMTGLMLDMNGRANPISPGRRQKAYSRANQSHILVSGTIAGIAARVDDALIERCTFLDNPGTCCIVMAQSNAARVELGRGWRLIDNEFRDNGFDTDDHSSVYGWADDVEVTGNRFINTRFVLGSERRLAGLVGYEVHGTNHVLRDNLFSGYFRGIWVAPNKSTPVVGTRIVANFFERGGVGVDFFGDRSDWPPIRDSVIEGNTFVFADDPGMEDHALKSCVLIASEAAQREITIARNRATSTSRRTATALAVITGGGLNGRVHDTITIVDNETDGLTFGSFIRTAPEVGLGSIVSQRNRWARLRPAGVYAIAVGDAVDHTGRFQPIEALALGGGAASGVAGELAYGVRVHAMVERLDVAPVSARGLAQVYWEVDPTIIHHPTGLAARR